MWEKLRVDYSSVTAGLSSFLNQPSFLVPKGLPNLLCMLDSSESRSDRVHVENAVKALGKY